MKRSSASTSEPPSIEEIKACIEKRLFIGRLSLSDTENDVRDVFSKHGPLAECRLVSGKGVAFVSYSTWAAAHKALLATDNQSCMPGGAGQPLVVSFAERSGVPKGSGSHLAKGWDCSRIFVGSLPEACSDNDLFTMFETFGQVQAANLLPAKPGGRRRCGFVNFALWGEAMDAVEAMHGQRPGSNSEALSVTLASPREATSAKKVCQRSSVCRARRRRAGFRSSEAGLHSCRR